VLLPQPSITFFDISGTTQVDQPCRTDVYGSFRPSTAAILLLSLFHPTPPVTTLSFCCYRWTKLLVGLFLRSRTYFLTCLSSIAMLRQSPRLNSLRPDAQFPKSLLQPLGAWISCCSSIRIEVKFLFFQYRCSTFPCPCLRPIFFFMQER